MWGGFNDRFEVEPNNPPGTFFQGMKMVSGLENWAQWPPVLTDLVNRIREDSRCGDRDTDSDLQEAGVTQKAAQANRDIQTGPVA